MRAYIAEQLRVLIETPGFVDALPGHLLPDPISQERLPIMKDRIKQIASASR